MVLVVVLVVCFVGLLGVGDLLWLILLISRLRGIWLFGCDLY